MSASSSYLYLCTDMFYKDIFSLIRINLQLLSFAILKIFTMRDRYSMDKLSSYMQNEQNKQVNNTTNKYPTVCRPIQTLL